MDEKGIGAVLVIAIVVIAVCVGAGAYLLLSRGGPGGGEVTGGEGGGGGGEGEGGAGGGGAGESPILTATSLSLKVTVSVPDQTTTMDIKMKNIGQRNAKYRVDVTDSLYGEQKFIYDNSTVTLWQWTPETGWENVLANIPIPGQYELMIQQIISQYIAPYIEALKSLAWVGGDVAYTDPLGRSVTISDIVVNPDLPDSLFQPS